MTPEAKVKKKVKEVLAYHKCYYTMPMGTGYGKQGVPDFLVCHNGRFIAVETKATSKAIPTALQQRNLKDIELAGGIALIIHCDNLDALETTLDQRA